MRINVVYSSDDNYAKFAGISMISLFENNKEVEQINIYFIENMITKTNRLKLESIVKKYNRNIYFISHSELCAGLYTDDKFSISAFSRLFLSKIDDIDKVLYLDCDTIINSSIKDLFEIDINDVYVCGVQDNAGIMYRKLIDFNENDRYINSGVLLINLKKWREENLEEKFIKFINKYNGSVPHHDQGVINGVCKGKIKILKPEYNLMPPMILQNAEQIKGYHEIKNYYKQSELNFAKQNPIIIHYTECFYNRPWRKKCTHPYKHIFANYKSISPWNDDPLEDKNISNLDKVKVLLFKYLPLNLIIKIRQIKRSTKDGFNIKCGVFK